MGGRAIGDRVYRISASMPSAWSEPLRSGLKGPTEESMNRKDGTDRGYSR